LLLNDFLIGRVSILYAKSPQAAELEMLMREERMFGPIGEEAATPSPSSDLRTEKKAS
jgi:hypothetical protein